MKVDVLILHLFNHFSGPILDTARHKQAMASGSGSRWAATCDSVPEPWLLPRGLCVRHRTLTSHFPPWTPQQTQEPSAPPLHGHITCPPLWQSHDPEFPTPLRQLQPPGPPSPAKYCKPTSRCVGHHKPYFRKQETNISHSFSLLCSIRERREVQVLMPLNCAEGRSEGNSEQQHGRQSHPSFFNFYIFLLCSITFHPGGPACPWLMHVIAQLPSASGGRKVPFPGHPSAPRGGKISTDCRRAKNVDK